MDIMTKLLSKGLTYREATAKARELEARANYLTKTLGAEITAEDIIEEA